ncbi:MAG TPA: hypothetical protein VNU71_04380 [Burkholderiaceae bacterium]|nr:hypothetical protein [Burkholderiaceae bacterium]
MLSDEALLLQSAQAQWDLKRAVYVGLVHDLFREVAVNPGELEVAAAELQRAMNDYMNLVTYALETRRHRLNQ